MTGTATVAPATPTGPPAAQPVAGDLEGTSALVRLGLRRDRIVVPAWGAVFVLMATFSAAATIGLYPTVASRVAAATSLNDSPSLVALYGRIYDPTSLGAVAMFKMAGLGAAFVAVFAAATVVRHTRAEEEAGRLELLGSTVLGRQAPLAAALVVAGGATATIGALTALGLMAAGLPARGSIVFGASWLVTGWIFAAIAGVAAQLATTARAANGLTAAVAGVAYVLRAIGDTSPSAARGGAGWLSWLSPFGWVQQARAFSGDRWPILAGAAIFAVAVAVAAEGLARRRDLGAGLLSDRPGRAAASPALAGPLALAWRLHRAYLAGWTAAFAFLGFVFGNLASNVGDLLDSPQARDMLLRLGGAKGLTDAFLATELGFLGIFASVFGVQVAMRLHTEEAAQRAEPILATAVSRLRWAASHVIVALAGTTWLLAVAGLTAGAAHARNVHDPAQVPRILGAALAHAPAAWVIVAIVVASFGLAPRLVAAGWAALVVSLFLGEIGPLLKLRQWVMDLSPFAHVPKLPGAELTATPLIVVSLVAGALVAAGLAGLRHRDIGAA